MIIRDMNLSDIEKIRAIAIETWKDTYSSFIPEVIQNKVLQDAYSDEEMDNRFKTSLNLVIESNQEIMGYAFFSGDLLNNEVLLESLYIHPNHQGKGIGKQLMKAGISKYKNPKTMSLIVYKGNASISFYEKIGFKIVKENNGDFFGHPIVFIVMKKELDN
ncbi:hypothetical protein DCE79_09670 [Lysinibacillus sp. 2017]|uniref:GNAT family N-acetyltransferase n=1 Tax=unclassified Lysinibacillus TaxID=2636778 RepID=UPI000D529CC2|nr:MULTISPECIES: GNAT family N-acetyltransferase [unclassified Lysinibacillus]AWE07634.1 hypothetical protein DCE79_09670 [Lysinibacillus sp. 2017]TGN36797.1 GNAT family N-acetyltransferase [Lysinibacillus sp. S2017]